MNNAFVIFLTFFTSFYHNFMYVSVCVSCVYTKSMKPGTNNLIMVEGGGGGKGGGVGAKGRV